MNHLPGNLQTQRGETIIAQSAFQKPTTRSCAHALCRSTFQLQGAAVGTVTCVPSVIVHFQNLERPPC
jgi:hypothetical protein